MCKYRSVPGVEHEYRSDEWFSCWVLGFCSLSRSLVSPRPGARTVPCPWSTQSMRLTINPPLSPPAGTNPATNTASARESLSVRDRSVSRAHTHACTLQGDQNRSRDGKKVQSRSLLVEMYQQVHVDWSWSFIQNIGCHSLIISYLYAQEKFLQKFTHAYTLGPVYTSAFLF